MVLNSASAMVLGLFVLSRFLHRGRTLSSVPFRHNDVAEHSTHREYDWMRFAIRSIYGISSAFSAIFLSAGCRMLASPRIFRKT